jgi:putative component of membrane protein insertase Oxa1/YidC/SpoIIIJ protein YidD
VSKIIASFIVGLHRSLAPIKEGTLLVVFGHVSHCRHHPSCSQYFLSQVNLHGWRGFYSGLKRLLACH